MANRPKNTSAAPASLRHRHLDPTDRPKKVGWQVRTSIADAVREVVDEGMYGSQNAFVEDALVRRLREIRQARLYETYAEAAADPDFMADMDAVARDFYGAETDGFGAGE
jgi:hypothetical protein